LFHCWVITLPIHLTVINYKIFGKTVRGFSQPSERTGSCDRPGPTLSPSSLSVHSLPVRVVFRRCPRCRWGPETLGSIAGYGLVCPASSGRPKSLGSEAGQGVPVPSGPGLRTRLTSSVGFTRSDDGHPCPFGSDPLRSIPPCPLQAGVGSVLVRLVRLTDRGRSTEPLSSLPWED